MALPSDVASILDRWRLTLDRPPLVTRTALIAHVSSAEGSFVLKRVDPADDEARTAEILNHWNGDHAVRLIAVEADFVLMERAYPGGSLADLSRDGRDDEATRLIVTLARALHEHGGSADRHPTIMHWHKGFARHRQSDPPRLDDALVDRAARAFAALARSQATAVLLHGDLHHDNILLDQRRGWLAIDPKGVIGEPAYEYGAMLRNPTPNIQDFADPAILDRRAAIIAEATGIARGRLLGWAFAQAVLAAIWAADDGADPLPGLATADAAQRLISATHSIDDV